MKRINRDGPPPRESSEVKTISSRQIHERIRAGDSVVDTRLAEDFARAHIASTINIPYNKSFLNWAGSLLPYDREIFFIISDGSDAQPIADDLALIGLERIGGVIPFPSIDASGSEMRSISQIRAAELKADSVGNGQVILDVRHQDEWDEGHIPGAIHIPLGVLQAELDQLPRDSKVAVHCQGGGRSAIAASILNKNGFEVSNVAGGFKDWEASGGAVAQD